MARNDGANPLASGDALDREPDVDGQADAVADRHVQRLDAARRVDRHGIDSAVETPGKQDTTLTSAQLSLQSRSRDLPPTSHDSAAAACGSV